MRETGFGDRPRQRIKVGEPGELYLKCVRSPFRARWSMGLMEKDPLVHSLGPLAEIDDWKAFLSSQPDGIEELRLHTRTGRPLGGESFVNLAEALTGRFLRKRKPGPKHRR